MSRAGLVGNGAVNLYGGNFTEVTVATWKCYRCREGKVLPMSWVLLAQLRITNRTYVTWP